jgi:Leucine rich repeat
MTTRSVPTSTRRGNEHPTFIGTSSNVALVVVFVAILSANVGPVVGSGGVCPPSCRCTERNAVVTCAGLVHVPPIPSIAIKLDLDHNRISLLLNTSLRGAETSVSGGGSWTTLRRLEVLSIEDNGLLYIEVGALSTLYELRELRLGRNHLSTLPRDLLAANRKLRVLDLHANYLASIPDGVVRLAHGLVVLNVSFNHLTSVRLGEGFRHVSQLSVIDLSG